MSDDQIDQMNELHAQLGRKAAELGLEVLEAVDVSAIPVTSAVALLKFGVELERKALLGAEGDDEDGADPFAQLANALETGQAVVEQIDDPAERRRMLVESKRILDRVFGGES